MDGFPMIYVATTYSDLTAARIVPRTSSVVVNLQNNSEIDFITLIIHSLEIKLNEGHKISK